MSTKNIARTAIEGGRVTSNKYDRWESNRVARKASRRLMRLVSQDPTRFDDDVFPLPRPAGKDFADKLSAPYRWLGKHGNGKTVHEIRGMLLRHFDTRTLAGRHLVFGHLMPKKYREAWTVYAGQNNILSDNGQLIRRPANPPGVTREKKHRIRARQWLATLTDGHRIGPTGNGFGLFLRLNETWQPVECTNPWCLAKTWEHVQVLDPTLGIYRYKAVPWTHPRRSIHGSDPVPYHDVPRYRLERMLTASEVTLWNALTASQRYKWDFQRNR